MSALGSFLFSNLVLPAIAVQANETDIDAEHKGAHSVAHAIPVDKLGIGSTGVGHDAAPAFARSTRNLPSLRQTSRPDDDALFQEMLAFRQWQAMQAGGVGYTPRQMTGSPANAGEFMGLRQRSQAPNIIVINAGDTSAYQPSNLSSTNDPGRRGSASNDANSNVQVYDGQGNILPTQTPTAADAAGLGRIPEEEGKSGKDVRMDFVEPVKPHSSEVHVSPGGIAAEPTATPRTADGKIDKVALAQKSYSHEELYVAATQFYHRLLAEALGTWAVTFFIAGLVIESSLGHIPQMGVAIGAGLVFVSLIYSLGQVSGAHFNPVVTYAFVLRGMFPLLWLPFYWIVQFVGALIAAAMLLGFYGSTVGDAGATLVPPEYSQKQGFLMETVLVMVLVFTILSMASRSKIVGPHAALAIGAVIAFNIMLAGSYSGASQNPWRSVCVSIVFPVSFYSIWVYFAGPFLGATIAVVFVFLLAGRPRDEELSAGIGATIAVAVGNAISRDDDDELGVK